MRRKPSSRRDIVAIIIGLLVSVGAYHAYAASNGADDFHKLTHNFIEADLKTYPEMATDEGDHRYDSRVTDLTHAAIEARIAATKKWKHRFENFPPHNLAPADEADREWLVAQLDGRLLDDETLRSYERAPDAYLPVDGLHSLIKRNFAPLEDRMRSATAREIASLHNLALARVNLKAQRTAPVVVEIVLSEMPGVISFLKKDLIEAFATIPASTSKKAFLDANAKLRYLAPKHIELRIQLRVLDTPDHFIERSFKSLQDVGDK